MDQLSDQLCVPSPKYIYGAQLTPISIAVYFYIINFQNNSEKASEFHGIAHIFAKSVLLLYCYCIAALKL